MSKIFAKIMALIMVLSLSIGCVSYSESIDYEHIADDLNKLKLFNGNGVSYDLDSKLKRSEAATLIVKLMGKNSEVTGKTYSNNATGLKDIKTDDWFYPYVDYCSTNGIIKGFPDGTFRPNDYITEKAFTQLLLGVMGYKSGTDFTWDNIFRVSLEVELNDDFSYAFNEEDNVEFYRKDAVKLLYSSLNKKMKGKTKVVVENLIDNKIIPIEVVNSLGLLNKDEIKTKITSVEVMNSKRIKVYFNEEVTVNSSDIVISDGKNDYKISKVEDMPTYVDITTTKDLPPNKEYSISFNVVTDKDNNVVKSLDSSFKGYEEDELVSDKFQISKVKVIDKQHVMVYFTHPINSASEEVLLYELYNGNDLMFRGSYKNLSVNRVLQYDNAILLTLKDDSLLSGNQYTLKIVGDLKSEYDSYLKNGDGDSVSFSLLESYSGSIEATSAFIYDKDLVKVEFNEALNYDDAKNTNNYYLTSNKSTLKIKPTKIYYSNELGNTDVYLRFPNMRTDTEYTLNVSEVHDVYGINKMNSFEQIIGSGLASESSMNIEYIEAISRDIIKIKFDNYLNEASLSSTVISINNGIVPKLKVISPDDHSEMIVYLNKTKYLSDDTNYEVQVKSGLIDIFDRKQKYTLKEDFLGTSLNQDSAEIDKISLISDNQLMVKFKVSLRDDSLSNIQNYKYEFKVDGSKRYFFPTKVKVIDSNTIILNFDYSYLEGEINFVAENMYDISGQYKYSLIEKSFLIK